MSEKTLRFEEDRVHIEVRGEARPLLCIESCPPLGRIALEGTTLGWFAPDRYWQYGAWLGSPPARSLEVIPPIRAREHPASWPQYFARALVASPRAPLHSGSWQLQERARPDDPPDAPESTPIDPHLPFREHLEMRKELRAATERILSNDHQRGWIPLRAPSPVDSARVKAWRKKARERALPPLLLLWVDVLGRHLLLDGHDRLLASLLEQQRPRAVALFAEQPRPIRNTAPREKAAAIYERAFQNGRVSRATALRMNERLLDSWGAPWRQFSTPARYTPDLRARFDLEVPHLAQLDPRFGQAFLR